MLQRVASASVLVVEDDRVTGSIGPGLLALVGFAPGDDDETLDWVAAKIAGLRVFAGDGGEIDRSLSDIGGSLLIVSQFTLYGDVRKGRRPDFGRAAPHEEARARYDRFVRACSDLLPERVEQGEFGERMRVELVNDGPVTIWIER